MCFVKIVLEAIFSGEFLQLKNTMGLINFKKDSFIGY